MLANNGQLIEKLRKPINENLKKRTVYSGFKGNIWRADLANMQLICKFNKRFRCLFFCVLLIFLINMHGLLL